LDCSGLSRVDFFIDKKNGDIYLNEINTIPGFTSISMFPKMCEAAGLSYKDLIDLLINQALERFESNKKLLTSKE
jgi:D-alanine-D-alanine ligase